MGLSVMRQTSQILPSVRQPSGLSRDGGTCLAGWPCERQGLWQEAMVAWPPASP